MVIAAFTGAGKTYFADHTEDSRELPEQPYKEKAVWPKNYIRAVSNQFHDYKYFIIPADKEVLKGLQLLQIDYVLAYPDRAAKEDYRGRLPIGDSDFDAYWDEQMNRIREDSYGWSVEIPVGKHLLDVKDEIDTIIDREEVCMTINVKSSTAEIITEELKKYDLSLGEHTRRAVVWAVHHNGETRRWFEKYKKDREVTEADLDGLIIKSWKEGLNGKEEDVPL